MDKICSKIRITDILVRLNNVRLYLRVSRLSDIVSEDGQWIHEWALHGPPSLCTLKWPKRRKPLEQNMRLWRDTIRQIFYGDHGLFLTRLGAEIRYTHNTGMVTAEPLFQDMLAQYPPRYQALLGKDLLVNAQADNIHALLLKGELYAGSDGSEKDGIGAHAYGFTSNKYLGTVWGGAAVTPGNIEEMASLRSELGGAIGILHKP